jgi:hypothetical protein
MTTRNRRPAPRPIIKVTPEEVKTDETAEVAEAVLTEAPEEVFVAGETAGTEIEPYVYVPNFEVTVTPPEVNEKGATKPKAEKKAKKAKRAVLFTPFQATKVLNAIRAKAGLTEVNSPMMYIYANKGAFTIGIAQDGTGRKVITDPDQFYEWAVAHTAAQVAKKAGKPVPAEA